jgi:chromosome segregation ATPase
MLILQLVLGVQASFKASGTTDAIEVNTATQMLNAMQTRLDQSEGRASTLSSQLASAQQEVQALTATKKDAEASLASDEAKIAKWHEVADTLQDQVQAAKDEATAAEAKTRVAVQKAKETDAALAAEAADLAKAEVRSNHSGDHFKQEADVAAEKARKAEAAQATSDAEREKAEAAAQRAGETVEKMRAAVRKVEAEKAAALKAAETAKTELREDPATIAEQARLKAEAAESKAELEEERAQAEQAEKDAGHFHKAADELSAKLSKLVASSNTTSTQKDKLAKVLHSRLQDLEDAEEKVSSMKSKVTAMESELAKEKVKTAKYTTELNKLQANVDKATADRNAAVLMNEKEGIELENATLKTQAAKAAAEEAVASARDTHRNLVQRLHEISALEDRVADLESKKANLTKIARDRALETKWVHQKDAAKEAALLAQLSQLKKDLNASKTAQVVAEKRSMAAARTATEEAEHAENEARVATRAQRMAAAATADERDSQAAVKAAEDKAELNAEKVRNATIRISELQEDLQFHLRTDIATRAALTQTNSSLSKANDQVSLLQRRKTELEDVSAQEASSRKEAENAREQLEIKVAEGEKALDAMKADLKKKAAALDSMTARSKSAESSENEYFDGMTQLQSAKDDLTQQLSDAKAAETTAEKKADDLEKTNEYLRGEKSSSDTANAAAMSDYLREIEQMKMAETKKDATIQAKAAEVQQLHSAVGDLWNELTPAQRKDLQAKAKAKTSPAASQKAQLRR